MIRRFFERDSVLKIISFLAAILVWLYVIYIEDPNINITVDDIPVYYKTSELADGLAVISYDVKEVDVKISANRSDIVNLEDEEIEAYIDLSKISEPGKYDNVKINVSTINKSVDIVNRSDKRCSVQIDEIVSKKVSVGVELTGDIPEGYAVTSEPVVFIDSTTITGPKTYIDSVKHAFIKVNCDNLKESKTISSDIYLLDKKGVMIDSKHEAYKHIKLSDKKSSAYVSVGKTKNVDIIVSGAEHGKTYSVSPSFVEIYSKNKGIDYIYTESIANKKPDKSGNISLKLIIPDGVELMSGNDEVTVNIEN